MTDTTDTPKHPLSYAAHEELDVEVLDDVPLGEHESADQRFRPPFIKRTGVKTNVTKTTPVKPPKRTGNVPGRPVIRPPVSLPVTRPAASGPKRPSPKRSASQPAGPVSVPVVAAAPNRLERVLSIINTTTGVLGLIHPLNSVFNANGTVNYPDGRVADTRNQTVTHPDGTVQHIDGKTVHSDGTVTHADGSVEYKDGTWKLADGSVKYPDGRWKHPDGTVTDAEGNVLGTVGPNG